MSRKPPTPPDRIPGLQYPSHLIESNQTDASLKNAFDNLFYLRKQLDTLMNAGTLTRAQVEEIVTGIIKNKTFNVIAEPVIVGTHATRLITAPVLGAAFYETDTSELFIGSDASGTLMWASLSSSGTGDVTGPAVSVDGDVAVFSGVTGKIIKDLASPGDATKFLNGASPPAYAKVKDSDLSTSNITTNNVTSAKHGFAPISPADATKFLNGAATPAYAQVLDSDLSTSDITTNNVTSAKHGFAPKSAADATMFLNSAATPAYAQVKDSDLSLSNITTNDVSITKHGFAPILPNDATKYLDGTGAYSTPAGGGGGAMTRISEQLLAADVASVTFSAIPNTYRHLLLVVYGRITPAVSSDYIYVQFNADTGANYDYQHANFFNGTSSVPSNYAQTSMRVGAMPGASAARSTQAGGFNIMLPHYAGTTWEKVALCSSADFWGTSGTGQERTLEGGAWRGTAAIATVVLLPASGNFKTGTLFSLYGIS